MKTATYKCLTPNCKATFTLNVESGEVQGCHCYEEKHQRLFKRVRGTTKDSVHRIFMPMHNASLTVDENASELDIRSAEPLFFARPFGKRETYTVYRGFMIVRHTVRHSNDDTHRCTVVYAFGKWGRQHTGTYCITSDCYSIAQAKRLIGGILKNNHWDRSKA